MRTPRALPVALLAAALLAAADVCALAGQEERGAVVGIVLEEGVLTPLEGAAVELSPSGLRVTTGADGSFNLRNLPTGVLTLRVQAPGYVTLVEDVEVAPGEVALLQLRLPRLGAALEELQVDVRGRDAGARERPRPLHRISAEATVVDLLANQVPGVDVRRGDNALGSPAWIVIRGFSSATQSNAPQVYVDGARVSSLDILSQIPAASVARIRVLRGPSATAEYMEGAHGIILIETHRGPGGGSRDGA